LLEYMATDSQPFLLKFWWLPPALIAVAAAIAAWSFREQPIETNSFPASLLQSPTALEAELGELPPQRVEYRAQVSIEVSGQRVVSTVRHVAEHLGGGWVRRSDTWYDDGAARSTYQERYLLHRNFLQVFRQHREKAPFVHDLMHEFGWLTDTASDQSVSIAGKFPQETASSLSVRQSRIAPTETQSLVPKATPYERTIECQRSGLVEGSSLGAALAGQLFQVTCRIRRTDLPGEVTNVFVWEPKARLFLLVSSQQPTTLGGVEVQTRRIEALSIQP
jgi:hypothetical protein